MKPKTNLSGVRVEPLKFTLELTAKELSLVYLALSNAAHEDAETNLERSDEFKRLARKVKEALK